MKFKIDRKLLAYELSLVQGVLERTTVIPVLSNVLLESLGENAIRITGTDLDITLRCEAPAEIAEPGKICVQARKLFDIVRLLESDDVHFEKEANAWVKMSCGRSNFRLAAVEADKFPETAQFKSAPLKLPGEIFNRFISSTSFAITNEQSRFTLSGAKFEIDAKTVRMVTTDGHRLALIETPIPAGATVEPMDVLIPKKALLEFAKISGGYRGEIGFGEDKNHIYFEVDGRLLTARKLTGTFPNYEILIPKDNDKIASFDAVEIKNAVRRVALMSDQRLLSIRLSIDAGEVLIESQSAEEGEAREAVALAAFEGDGDGTTFGFNHKYLSDFLAVVTAAGAESRAEQETEGDKVKVKESAGSPRVSLSYKDADAQTVFTVDGDDDYKYILMPLRV